MKIKAKKLLWDLGYKLYIKREEYDNYPAWARFNIDTDTKIKIVSKLKTLFESVDTNPRSGFDMYVVHERASLDGNFYTIEIKFNNPADEAYFIMLTIDGIKV